MIDAIHDTVLENRVRAGLSLAKKLTTYEKTNSIVIGIPHGGMVVAAAIASDLHLPLEVLPCRRIKHPADSNKNVGAVCLTEVFMHDSYDCIPQDLIAHQIA